LKNHPRPTPVILDTDIGDDIDDTWALALLLRCPELDLKLVTTATGATTYRARIVARLLEVAGRSDVAVGVGRPEPFDPARNRQAAWVAGYELEGYRGAVHADGVAALVEAVMASPEPVTIIGIAPLGNIAAALAIEPRIASRARFVGMHGAIRKGYAWSSRIEPEFNVAQNVAACRSVFAAPWDVTLTPLDTCGRVVLEGDHYQWARGCGDPLMRAVMENYQAYEGGRGDMVRSTVLFDTVAVYLAFAEELLAIESLGVGVTDEGMTIEDPTRRPLRCAMGWKSLDGFHDLLVERLTRGGRVGPGSAGAPPPLVRPLRP
jgi:inosine-uridine nucleoside N-ribohydrolase